MARIKSKEDFMIKWLRDKFASAISFFFVLSVILSTVSGGIAGFAVGKSFGYYDNYSDIGCFIGLIIGCLLGIICGILTFGYFATIVHISELIDKENCNNQNIDNSAKTWKCNNCGTENDKNWNNCSNCGKSKLEATEIEEKHNNVEILENGDWKCPFCGSTNTANDKRCYCGFKRE